MNNILIKVFRIVFMYIFCIQISFGQGVTLQENSTGFCSVDGIIDVGVAGYTGAGFANTTSGVGVSITWSVFTNTAGKYKLYFRYANGGTVMPLKGSLSINDSLVVDTVTFKHTGKWTNWAMSDTLEVPLKSGQNLLRLKSYIVNGLPNLDYLYFMSTDVTPYTCLPTYKLTLGKNISNAGTVSYSPVQEYYEKGTLITLKATANPGYFFHSWNGQASSALADYTFAINTNSNILGMFYPNGTQMDTKAIGYATVLDDKGTPFMMIGGALGDTVDAHSVDDLIKYLGDTLHRVVRLSQYFKGAYTTEIKIKSNKTLLGVTDSAHIEGMRVTVGDAQNVIFKNVTFSKVERYDAMQLNNARNIWIDHCDFFGDRIQPLDFYDGLLDIKNASRHITISWSKFHDHLKAILISSGDEQTLDTAARLTFHHNYFYNCDARLPSLRFGKAHVFSNYFKNNGSAVSSRMNACVRVENNYFNNSSNAVRVDQSVAQGQVQLINNVFNQSNYVSTPSCDLKIPYSYVNELENPNDLPFVIANENLVGVNEILYDAHSTWMLCYPNPATYSTTLRFNLTKSEKASFVLSDITGKAQMEISEKQYIEGENELILDFSGLRSGVYICKLKTLNNVLSKYIVVE